MKKRVKDNLLKVHGEAILYVTPEILVVSIPIRTIDSIYENCSQSLVNKYNQLKEALIKNGIEDKLIKSDRLDINENYLWTEKERKFDGYVGSINVEIEIDYSPDKLNSIIETLKDDSFKFGYNLSFKLSESQKSVQLQNVIDLAIKDAQNKGEIIAKSLKIQLAEIQEINFGYTNSINDLLTFENKSVSFLADNDSGIELNLNPKMISIQKRIEIIWKIEQ
jgi:uncharacterized protein YggE